MKCQFQREGGSRTRPFLPHHILALLQRKKTNLKAALQFDLPKWNENAAFIQNKVLSMQMNHGGKGR